MVLHYFVAFATLATIFILFLVISRTLSSIVHQLRKLDYLLNKEIEYRRELEEIRRLMDEEMKKKRKKEAEKEKVLNSDSPDWKKISKSQE